MREAEKRAAPLAKALRRTLTEAELILWSQLNKRAQRSVRFRRQHPVGPYIADFACVAAKLIVEIDGSTHGSDVAISHDVRRTEYLTARGWLVIRFTNDEVYRQLGTVLDGIWTAVDVRLR